MKYLKNNELLGLFGDGPCLDMRHDSKLDLQVSNPNLDRVNIYPFTPFVGFHFVLAAITAWIVRGNILASAIGTAAGNPWTFPFIWVSVLYTGRKILGLEYADAVNVNFETVFTNCKY